MSVGVLGAGNISDTHARAARALGLRVAAVCGTNPQKTARLAADHGAAAYSNLEAFLEHRPMDLVAIGSPSGRHAEQAIEAVRRGLHVLVEKPIDITTSRVDALIDEAARSNVKVGVFFQDRLKPDIVRVKTLIERGAIGAPVLASGRVKWYRPPEYYSVSRWRGTWALDGGGALMNQGIHTVDLLLWLFGPVARVAAATATRLHRIEVEDTAVAALTFVSGALGVIEAATSVFPGYSRRLELTGSEGTLVIDQDRLIAADVRNRDAADIGVDPRSADASAASPVVADAEPHRRVFDDFVHAIRSNGTPACDAREGRRSVQVVEAIYASARSGRAVELT